MQSRTQTRHPFAGMSAANVLSPVQNGVAFGFSSHRVYNGGKIVDASHRFGSGARNLDASTAKSLRIRFLGEFSVTDPSGRSLCPRGRKPAALLAYILYNAGRDISREELIELFWQERDPKQGRDSLRQALYILRSALDIHGDALLHVDRYVVRASPEYLSCDLWDEEGAICWNETRPFLENFAVAVPGFDEWVRETARSIRNQQIAQAERRLAELDPEREAAAALACAEAILVLDPHNEPVARRAMEFLAIQGKNGHALRVFERLRAALRADDLDVSNATRDLLGAISANRYSPAADSKTPRAGQDPHDSRGLPRIRIEISDDEENPRQKQNGSEFYDHLVLRLVQMQELKLLKSGDPALGPNYVVFVSVGATHSGARISLRLRAPDGQFVWSGRVDMRETSDDQEVNLAVEKLVMQMLSPLEEHFYFSLKDKFATAYGCFIEAKRVFWTAPQSGYMDKVVSCLHRAIEIDPEFLPPYSMLVMYYNTGLFMSRPGTDHGPKRAIAFELAQKLLFLNANYANSHISMSWCLLWRRKFDLAERSIRRAMELNPYEPHRLSVIGTALVYLGHDDEGERYYDMAQERQHHDFDFQRTDYGEMHFLRQDYEQALSWMEVPEFRAPYKTLFFRAAANAQLGRRSQAQADVEAFSQDMRDRWAGPEPYTTEAGFQWYADMLPLRSGAHRRTLHEAMTKLGLSVKVPDTN